MKNTILNRFKIVALALLVISICSCSKEEINLSNLNETFFVKHKNADMPVYIHGNGSEKVFLIILHGGPGGQGLHYRANTILTEVEKNNAVVYFDQRGSGSSQGNYANEDLSIDLMAEDVLALAKVIKARYGDDSKLFLMGHSWGGTLGTAVLLKNQDEFSGWIEVCGGHNMGGLFNEYRVMLPNTANEQIALGNSVSFWQNVLESVQNVGPEYTVQNVLSLNRIASSVTPVLAEDDIINEPQALFDDKDPSSNIFRVGWNTRKIGLIMDYEKGLNEVSFTNQLSEITIPSLVLWGKYDHTIPLVFGHEAFENLGSNEKSIFIFEKSAHGPMYTEPDLFADKVIEFINYHK